MHGTSRRPDRTERVTWLDLVILSLPVVCGVLAFVIGNGVLDR